MPASVEVPAPPAAVRPRVSGIDVVRGLVMVVMTLDHVRDFVSSTPFQPTDLAQTTGAWFFTRWLTHFCAPTFVLLSGVSIWLAQQRRGSRGATSRLLLTRGLWLVLLEVLVLSWVLKWDYQLHLLLVIWAIGWGMVLLAGLLWLPRPVLVGLAALILLGHNALPAIQPVTAQNALAALLHNGPFVLVLPGLSPLLVAYSIGPWLGVLLAGYLLGPWFERPGPAYRRRLRAAGAGLLLLFGTLRATNWYGDPAPWSAQPRGGFYSALSFLNVTKSPPSLLFLSLTLGVTLLLLSTADQWPKAVSRRLRTFGRVPFFYYLLHLMVVSGGAWLWTRGAFGRAVNLSMTEPAQWPAAYHPSGLRAYAVWLAVVLLLYWPCRWYAGYKQRHRHWWLSYL